MSARTKVNLLENSSVSLKVTVPKADVKSEYDSLLKEYSVSIGIKGFRKGKVPADVLERKFGESLKNETAQKLIEKSLQQAFEKVEHKPLPYSIPELKGSVELDPDKPLSFEVTYDTFPKIELGEYRGLEAEEPAVTYGNEDVDRELEGLQEQNAIVIDKRGGKIEKGDTVTLDYAELDTDGTELEGRRREGFTFSVGSGYNIHKIDDDILGMVKDEERILEKEYPEDFEYSELSGKKVRLKVKVINIKEKKLPEIDDELAQDVSEKYETLEDLKKDIKERLGQTVESRLRDMKVLQILEKVVEGSTIPLPQSMVEQELGQRWQNFVRQFRTDENTVVSLLRNQGKEKEDLLNEWRPGVEKALKMRLVENRIIEEESPSVEETELEDEMKKAAEAQDKELDEIREEYTKGGLMSYLEDTIKTRKVHDLILEAAKVKKGKKVKYLDFIQGKG